MSQAFKICPRCQWRAPLNTSQCNQCGHIYRTQFAWISPSMAAPTMATASGPASAPGDLPPLEMAIARQKSYTTHAVGVFVLYFVLWLPGFIANWMFLREAEEQQRRAGIPLPGVTALRYMLWFWGVVLGLVVALFLLLLALALLRGGMPN